MAFNPGNCYYYALGFDKPFPGFYFNDITYENTAEEKIFGIVIDNKLTSSLIEINMQKG